MQFARFLTDAGVCRVSVHSLELAGVKDLALGFCCP